MTNLTRRGFIAATLATAGVRLLPTLSTHGGRRVVLRLVYDKSLGMMRAIERIVP